MGSCIYGCKFFEAIISIYLHKIFGYADFQFGALHLWLFFVINSYKYNGALHLQQSHRVAKIFVEILFLE